jgi:N-methylhydantoinase B
VEDTVRDLVDDPVSLEIAWRRLEAIINESEATLIRASFSPLIREAFDFGVLLLDACGGSVVQSQRSIPSFVGTLPQTLRAGLAQFSAETWRPGDVLATNDPWLGTGHLPDVTAVRPIFRGARPVAYAGCIAHWADIGGANWSADSREVYEEGLRLPPTKLVSEGRLNEQLAAVIAANVRVPEQVLGDLHAQLAALEVTERRFLELLDDLGITDPAPLFAALQQRTERGMRAAIAELPDGVYRHAIAIDGVREPLSLQAAMTVAGEDISVDWAGTSGQVDHAINETWNHAYAMTVYPIKCALSPALPNNEGACRPITMVAPEGSLVNATPPAAVAARQMIGHYVSAVVLGALAQVVPDQVPAECGSPAPRVVFTGSDGGRRYVAALTLTGGMGAQATRDGLAAMPFPTNSGGTSAEIIEAGTPLVVRRRQLRSGSGGAGRHRGGLGVSLAFQSFAGEPCTVSMMADRVDHPPRGLLGGGDGAPNVLRKSGGEPVNAKARTLLMPGETIEIETAGGAGYGPVAEREPELIRTDLQLGYVTERPAPGGTP